MGAHGTYTYTDARVHAEGGSEEARQGDGRGGGGGGACPRMHPSTRTVLQAIQDSENKLKQQQNLFEIVLNERNLYRSAMKGWVHRAGMHSLGSLTSLPCIGRGRVLWRCALHTHPYCVDPGARSSCARKGLRTCSNTMQCPRNPLCA